MPIYYDTSAYPDKTTFNWSERMGPVRTGSVDNSFLSGALRTALLTSSPLTGIPTAPTAANGTNTTQVATCAFVLANAGSGSGSVTLTGDATGTGTGTISVTFPTVNSTVGTYPKVTVNGKGQVTAGAALASSDLPSNAVLPGTGAVTVPVGTTGQQPGSPTNGMLRYNSTTSRYEFYIGAAWINHVRLTGETGTVDLSGSSSVLVPTPTLNGQACTKAYADALVANQVSAVNNAFLGWDNTGAAVAKTLRRVVSGTTDTPTVADHQSTIECTSASATTVTIPNLGAGFTYVVRRTGAGTVTLAAGSGVTFATTSDNTSPSYQVLQHGTLVVYHEATSGSVAVDGKMA